MLGPGCKLAHYEIVGSLGVGGMAEVYGARDTRLNREAAIKIIPDGFANDPDRVMRFTREAQTLSLNHPHIAHIFGIEEIAASDYAATRARHGVVPGEVGFGQPESDERRDDAAHCGVDPRTGSSGPAVKIRSVTHNNRKKVFEVDTRVRSWREHAFWSSATEAARVLCPESSFAPPGARRLRFTDALTEIRSIVTPDILLAWHRALIARKYDGHLHRGPGRPRASETIRDWVVRMATENRSWGYTRIQGALANLDHPVSRGTIANILKQHGIEPAPERQRRTTWQEFLRTHRGVLAAADFFSVEVWTARGLTRFAVLFAINLATRRVEIAGIVREPDSAWVVQCGRQLTDPDEGCLRGKRFLLHDRDPRFTATFTDTLAAAGVETVRLPPRSPNLNAYAERFVRTIKESCLDRLILIGARSLRDAIHEFVQLYHHERNHQGMGNRLLFPVAGGLTTTARLRAVRGWVDC